MPPATMTSKEFVASRSWANIAAFIPEPHILFTVVQPAASGSPAPSEAWRAGAWPWPAGRTQPMITSCTCSGPMAERSTPARGKNATDDEFLPRLGPDARALDGGADCGRAELRRGEGLQLALERTHRGAGDGDDDDRVVLH